MLFHWERNIFRFSDKLSFHCIKFKHVIFIMSHYCVVPCFFWVKTQTSQFMYFSCYFVKKFYFGVADWRIIEILAFCKFPKRSYVFNRTFGGFGSLWSGKIGIRNCNEIVQETDKMYFRSTVTGYFFFLINHHKWWYSISKMNEFIFIGCWQNHVFFWKRCFFDNFENFQACDFPVIGSSCGGNFGKSLAQVFY